MFSSDAAMLRCVQGTSLGAPVVPPVNNKRATSSPSIELGGSNVGTCAEVDPISSMRTREELPDPSTSMIQQEMFLTTLFANSNLFSRCPGTRTPCGESAERRAPHSPNDIAGIDEASQ